MRIKALTFAASFLLISNSSAGIPQSISSATISQQMASKDPQAITVMNQALNAAGGISAISTIEDYTATGIVTYYAPNSVTGPITIRESGLTQLRFDAELPEGMRSKVIDGGEVTFREAGETSTASEEAPIYPGCIVLPNLFLAAASVGPDFSLTYKGIVVIDGHSTHDLQIQRVLPGPAKIKNPEILTTDVFIEETSFQVLMIQNSNSRREITRIRYSNYRSLNGVLVPFTIGESIAEYKTWTVQISQINLNTGLQDSDFQL